MEIDGDEGHSVIQDKAGLVGKVLLLCCLERFGKLVSRDNLSCNDNLVLEHLSQIGGVTDVWMGHTLIRREYLDLDIRTSLGNEVADCLANLSIGANVEDFLVIGNFNDLVVHRCSSHGISRPDANLLFDQVGICLDHFHNFLSSIVELLHFVQVSKSKVSSSTLLIFILDELDNFTVDSSVSAGVDVIHRCLEDANDASNFIPVDTVSGYFVGFHEDSTDAIRHVDQRELQCQGQKRSTVLLVSVVDGKFRTGE